MIEQLKQTIVELQIQTQNKHKLRKQTQTIKFFTAKK